MKKTKFLTCLAALTLLLASCEVTAKDLGSDTTDTESSDTTTSDTGTGGDTGESGDTGDTGTGEGGDTGTGGDGSGGDGSGDGGDGGDTGGPTITYTYSLEVENGDSLTLNYDEALETQQGVELSIKLVTTSSTGDVTKEDATADNLTFTVSDPTIVTISGLTVLPLSGGETSITVKWSEHEDATTSVGVTVTDVTVYGPTTWDEYITNEYDRGVIADFLGSVGVLDELLPFYLGDTNPTVTTGNSVSGQRLIITYNTATSTTLSTWVSLLEADGWEQTGHETSYNEVYTFTKDGYTVEVNLEFGSLYLYLYPPEPEPEPASTWNEYITNENYRAAIAEIFGSVEALDEFLPFYSDTEPTSIVTGTHYSKGARLVIQYNSDVLSAWVSLFEADGWTQTDHAVSYNETYTFEKDGYTVDLELEYGVTYVYAYPKAEEGDEDLETAQAILNAAAAQTNGYAGFDNLHIDSHCPESGYTNYTTTATGDLTVDENNCLYGKFQWLNSDEPGPRIRYYYNDNSKYYYDNMSSSGNHSYTAAAQNNATGERTIQGLLSARLVAAGISSSYDIAFTNASSIDLASATDLELTTEDNGNYKLTLIYNDIWYCYKATSGCELVGAGYSTNWTSSTNFEIVYGEQTTRAAIDEIMNNEFFSVEVWFPKEASDEEIAQEILNAVQGSTPNWTAFYGNAEDTWGGELTSYLALDANGALYGYKDSDDWDDETYTYYFYNGYRCMYNTYNVAQEPKEITTTFDEELELYIAGLSVSFNLSTDNYELGEVNDGYSLAVTHNYIEYTFIVDASYNLLSLEREQLLGSSSDYVGWSYVEGLDFEDVEYALSETDFDPDDFFGEQGGDEETGEEPSGLTLADYIAALSDKGFNYGDGFYFCQQSLDMSSGLDYDSLEIEALSNDVGYASQGHYDIGSGYYASEFYSDGTTTYVYDTDDQEAADAGDLYGYWFYQYTLESYFDLDTIVEQLNSLGEDADLTDSDNVITDDYLYLYAYSADYSAMVELFATYDESGITYLVYSYGTNTSSYAVEFYPTESVTTPEWYVPTTGSSAIADLFNAALEEKNYTIVLEITDYQSNETSYAPNGFSPYVQLEPLQDLWCKITYTADAAVVEYYANYEEFLAGTVMDVEYYLNTDSGLDIFMVFYWYDVNSVYFQWTEEGLTWQDYLGSLFGLEDYFANFVEGETTTTERGTEVSYTLDNLDSDFLEALINALVDNGNYWAWETHGVEQILFEGADVSYTVTYLEDSGIIEFVFVSDEYTYYDADNYCYYLEQTTIKVYVLDAGSSSAPDYTLEYNW